MSSKKRITVADLEKIAPSRELEEEVQHLIRGKKPGRILKLERIIAELARDGRLGLSRLCLLSLGVFTHWRDRFPTGLRAKLLHRLGVAWIDAEKALGTDGRGRDHIGYEYLVNDAIARRDWNEALEFAKRAQREGWEYDWSGAIEFAERKIRVGR